MIGVGNPYRGDDGVGPAVLDLLARRGMPAGVLVESTGDTAALIEAWDGARLAIVVDAVRAEPARPGRVHRVVARGVLSGQPAASSHGLGLGEAVELARAIGRLPATLVLYAIEIGELTYGAELSAPVGAAAQRVARHIAAGTFGTADRGRRATPWQSDG